MKDDQKIRMTHQAIENAITDLRTTLKRIGAGFHGEVGVTLTFFDGGCTKYQSQLVETNKTA